MRWRRSCTRVTTLKKLLRRRSKQHVYSTAVIGPVSWMSIWNWMFGHHSGGTTQGVRMQPPACLASSSLLSPCTTLHQPGLNSGSDHLKTAFSLEFYCGMRSRQQMQWLPSKLLKGVLRIRIQSAASLSNPLKGNRIKYPQSFCTNHIVFDYCIRD